MPHEALSEWFDRFYRAEHKRVIKWLVVAESATVDEAQDSTDLAMADLWRRRRAGQEIHNPSSYVRTAARRSFLKLRNRMRERELPCAPEEECFTTMPCEDSVEIVWADRQWVAQLLAPLSDAQREVMELVVFDDLKPFEIAQVLGKSQEAVRQNLHHAKKKLHAQLRDSMTGRRVIS